VECSVPVCLYACVRVRVRVRVRVPVSVLGTACQCSVACALRLQIRVCCRDGSTYNGAWKMGLRHGYGIDDKPATNERCVVS
jgi:hypothetical protein